MNIVVTGGAGFIGSHIVDAYLSLGHRVLVLDDLSSGQRGNVNPNAELVVADLRTETAVRAVEVFSPAVVNFHAAQISVRHSVGDPVGDAMVNIVGNLSVLQAAHRGGKLQRVVYAASGGTRYGDQAPLPTRETEAIGAGSPYGVSKATFELYLASMKATHGLHYVALRYSNVYGPRQNAHGEAGVVAIFCERLRAGLPCTIFGDGDQTRDFIFVGDVVTANVKALGTQFCGGVNIGVGRQTSVNQIYQELATCFAVTLRPQYQPARTGEQRHSVLDNTLAKAELGFSPAVALNQGIVQTAAWYQSLTR
jgi:UDP-glucose 4-epimerase